MTAELIQTLLKLRSTLDWRGMTVDDFIADRDKDENDDYRTWRNKALERAGVLALDAAIADVRRMDALEQVMTIDGNRKHGYWFADDDDGAHSVGGDGETFRQVVDDYAAKVEAKINKGERT